MALAARGMVPITMQKRERYVWVCTKRRPDGNSKGSCAEAGAEPLLKELKIAAGKAGVDARVASSGCFDLCWVGPAVAVMPDMTFFGGVTRGDIPAIVDALGRRENVDADPALRDKVVRPEQFEDPSAKSG
jgi:(2Fe-2S) ferredoxin